MRPIEYAIEPFGPGKVVAAGAASTAPATKPMSQWFRAFIRACDGSVGDDSAARLGRVALLVGPI
jgi:hypothetical protein